MTHTQKAGFTFIELAIAITVMAIIMVVIGPRFMSWIGKSKDSKAKLELHGLKFAIQEYYADINSYPEKLVDLVQKPANVSAGKWRRAYIDPETITVKEGAIVDPWENPYHYRVTKGGKHPYELNSEGDPEAPYRFDAWQSEKGA